MLLTLLGTPPPFAIPAAASLAFAVLLGAKCVDDVRTEAAEVREEWRHATASLLQRSALARSADAGAADALYRVAEHGDGRVLVRVRATLEHAPARRHQPVDRARAARRGHRRARTRPARRHLRPCR
ncbi:hypothetical protein SANTM175S_03317 [Streptomyces antimycoticus]